ncbi:MAG: hypothetical protein F6K36_16930 [Symploca sp. SIO3C6]|uniref:Uncharacterized protein n=1 Tax=Symploca sp. SIO1C4 TaxID=2607765 RepID=A0A6B3NL17_9CYAN|nr:hypothetical protein [Symploca sp. SIO3C6]NER30301.1 hypothetical protein [Symploca sp. SIO1C4]NET03551.1 hypothetical protein [Symploca sp. SIO2B6]NET50684.1 hypothetical protein [Merismopedia sp. SIO2A8]
MSHSETKPIVDSVMSDFTYRLFNQSEKTTDLVSFLQAIILLILFPFILLGVVCSAILIMFLKLFEKENTTEIINSKDPSYS